MNVWTAMFHLRNKDKLGMLNDAIGGYLTLIFCCEKLSDFMGMAIRFLENEGVLVLEIEDIACITSEKEAESRGTEFFTAWGNAVSDGTLQALSLHRYFSDDG